MRVAFITTYFLPVVGGIEVHVRDVARALQLRGIDVVIRYVNPALHVAPSRISSDPEHFQQISSFGIAESLRWPKKVVPDDVDVVHFHGFSRLLFLKTLGEVRDKPIFVTPHGGIQGVRRGDRARLRRGAKLVFDRHVAPKLLTHVERVFCISAPEFHHARHVLGLPPEKLALLPNPVGRSRVESASRERGRYLVLARQVRIKRLHDVVAALERDRRLAGCDIAGPRGDATGELERQIRRLPPGRVRLLGTVDGEEKAKLLANACALILPSEVEASSLAGLEALASGTPVIASEDAARGLPRDGVVRYATGDVDALIDRLRAVSSSDASYSRLCEAAACAGTALDAPDDYAGKLVQFYRSALDARCAATR